MLLTFHARPRTIRPSRPIVELLIIGTAA